jgi:hypothetical protein
VLVDVQAHKFARLGDAEEAKRIECAEHGAAAAGDAVASC